MFIITQQGENGMPKKTPVRRTVVTPDKHFPLADMPSIKAVCKAIEIVKPDTYIDLGDVGEWESVSHWKWKRKKRPPLEYLMADIEKDIKDVNKGMDIIDESLDKVKCKNKHFCEGNHDDWLNQFNAEHPYLKLSTKDALNLDARKYTYHAMGKYFKLGKLYFYHGHHYTSLHHAKNHLMKLGVNIMYGHHHDLQQASVTHMDGQKSAWSIGCLKDMSDEENQWLGNRKTNWSHAFSIVDFFENGYFTVHVIQIIKGKASLWGEIIDGNL